MGVLPARATKGMAPAAALATLSAAARRATETPATAVQELVTRARMAETGEIDPVKALGAT